MKQKARLCAAPSRMTFKELAESCRLEAADSIWHRAIVVSKLRHLARTKERTKLARRLGEVKARLIKEVCHLAPELVRVVRASDHDRLFSVRYRGGSRLHLPLRLVPS
jgi:hypothetical protein